MDEIWCQTGLSLYLSIYIIAHIWRTIKNYPKVFYLMLMNND